MVAKFQKIDNVGDCFSLSIFARFGFFSIEQDISMGKNNFALHELLKH
jgi:hypothetical protein